MRLFLVETDGGASIIDEPDHSPPLSAAASTNPRLSHNLPSPGDMISLLRSSLTISRASIIAFFYSLSESGLHASLLYYLKAKFHFNKDQFADLLLIVGLAGALSQLLLMPLLVPIIGEEKLLGIGLLASCIHVFLYSIAWSSWVPYFSSIFVVMSIFVQPCVRSIVSKNVGPNEQGLAQGCTTGISSFASIISPLAFTPLTALFLSESAPFKFKGFSIMCIGVASLIAFALSIMMRGTPVSGQRPSDAKHERVSFS